MRFTRRDFVKATAAGGVGAMVLGWPRRAWAFYQSPGIPLFGTTLRGIGTIGVAAPDILSAPVTNVKHYTLSIDQFSDAGVCPWLGGTTLRGYNPTVLLAGQNNKHLGGIIVGKGRSLGVPGDSAEPIQITFRNNLPGGMHIIPNDTSLPGANQGNNRTAVHFHGGLVPWISDGGPFDWWDPAGTHGLSFLNNSVLRTGTVPANEAEYYYPLNQSARFGWYHDHAFGITRINAYAGIASALIIRDGFEASLVGPTGLPGYVENLGNEIPIIIQDKIFVGSDIGIVDPSWAAASSATTPGSLWYAHTYDPRLYKLGPSKLAVPSVSVVPEFFGDTMLANGTVYPEALVNAQRYRLRVLNACNARFLNLQLYVADGSADGITLNPKTLLPTNQKGPDFLVIGAEGGFLKNPVLVPSNVPFNPVTLGGSLVTAPAERWDIIVDFKNFANKNLILYNDAPAPFPVGSPGNDYFPGLNTTKNPVNGLTAPGNGPNTRVIMRFNVVTASVDQSLTITPATDLSAGLDPWLGPAPSAIVPQYFANPRKNPFGASVVRMLTLNEAFDQYGRLIQLLGTNVNMGAGFGRAYTDTTTENVAAGSTEIWQIANLTGDTHPIHFHLVNVQIVARQPFQVSNFNGIPNYIGPARGPNPTEFGWKETVQMHPGEVTTVVMRFDLAAINTAGGASITTPISPRTGGHEFVWHCHILEHEEHDMMRPLVVT